MKIKKKWISILISLGIIFIIFSSWIDVILLKDFVCENLEHHSLLYFYLARNVAEVVAAMLGFFIGINFKKIIMIRESNERGLKSDGEALQIPEKTCEDG